MANVDARLAATLNKHNIPDDVQQAIKESAYTIPRLFRKQLRSEQALEENAPKRYKYADKSEPEPADADQSEPEFADATSDEIPDQELLLTEKLRSPGAKGSNEISTRGLLVSLLALAAIIVVAMLVAAPKS